jgi:D-arabinitol dehydrogenase (NADP+)
MRAVVYDVPRHFRVAEVDDPWPGPGQVRLRVRATGVCGTDVHLHAGEFFPVYPLIPGHEIVGEVDAAGADVTEVAVGQLVALDNMITCGVCSSCRRGRPAYCTTLHALGVTDPGGFADYVVAPAGKCHPVDDLGLDTAVLAEPTACAVHGLDVLAPSPGTDVLILGAGPTGLILAQLLRNLGAGRLTVAAPTRYKLDLAEWYGADETVELSRSEPEVGFASLRSVAPDGFDIVIDATGALSVLERGTALLADGGTLFVYGMTAEQAVLPISPYDVFRRELTIKGSFSQSFSFDRAIRLLRTGRVRSDGLITHRFGLGSYADAIQAVGEDSSCLKAVVEP